ncbi:hypothetical protein HU200_049139 [Digitaria exilis]|uniref:Uncharacterized protein n=1 Tax=Digitaria exilis TaxID=1010633 RepID=A0A835EA60_9POAL|nr:hypothetical protein HU200_049139 [Digitaria exilis]
MEIMRYQEEKKSLESRKNSSRSRGVEKKGRQAEEETLASGARHGGDSPELRRRGRREALVPVTILLVRACPEAAQGESATPSRRSKNPPSPLPDLTRRLTDLNHGPDQAESPASPTASAPGRAEEDSAPAAPERSAGSAEDAAAAAAQKDQGADKPAAAAAESSKRKKEPEQQQPAAPWAKLLSQCSQVR